MQRVVSELDSFRVQSRNSSVIRCSSTPDPERGESSSVAIENCPHSLPQPSSKSPIPIILDFPRDYYNLNPSLSDLIIPSVEEEIMAGASVEENLNQDDKALFKAKQMRLRNVIKLYNPDKFQAQVLASNKEEWIASAKTVYENLLDFAEEVSSKPEITPGQDVTIENEIDKAGKSSWLLSMRNAVLPPLLRFNFRPIPTTAPTHLWTPLVPR